MKNYLKLISRETTKWDSKLMKRVPCEPYYKGLLGSDSILYPDNRLSMTNTIIEGKEYIDRIIAIHPHICGFVLFYKGFESRHIYVK